MVLQLALDRPELVQTLILTEPAAGGGFAVPAAEELGRRFIGPAMEAFAAGDLDAAFDRFMRGVCGENYRSVLEQRLGSTAVDRALRQSAFFFRDEAPAVLESTFDAADASFAASSVDTRSVGASGHPRLPARSRVLAWPRSEPIELKVPARAMFAA